MEKGTFHTSVKSIIEMDDFVEKIPLPNQMPREPNLAQLPPNTMHSSAVETLLGQNTDLMARLGVSLRKGTVLEQKLGEMERENLHLRHRYETMRDQVLVIQEKERLLSERFGQLSSETNGLRERLATFERHYADVYMQAQISERQLNRLHAYRLRVRKFIGNVREKAAELLELLNSNEKVSPRDIGQILALAAKSLQQLRTDNSEAQIQIVNRYESDLSYLRSELELRRREAADRDLLYEAKIRIENQLVSSERQSRQYRDETQSELQMLKEEHRSLSQQLKSRLIDTERLEREISIANTKAQSNVINEKEKTDQIESLQLLWKEKQSELERLEEKNRALQKLNQQLSVNLNTQRKELGELRSEFETVQLAASEKIKALEQQL